MSHARQIPRWPRPRPISFGANSANARWQDGSWYLTGTLRATGTQTYACRQPEQILRLVVPRPDPSCPAGKGGKGDRDPHDPRSLLPARWPAPSPPPTEQPGAGPRHAPRPGRTWLYPSTRQLPRAGPGQRPSSQERPPFARRSHRGRESVVASGPAGPSASSGHPKPASPGPPRSSPSRPWPASPPPPPGAGRRSPGSDPASSRSPPVRGGGRAARPRPVPVWRGRRGRGGGGARRQRPTVVLLRPPPPLRPSRSPHSLPPASLAAGSSGGDARGRREHRAHRESTAQLDVPLLDLKRAATVSGPRLSPARGGAS